MSNLITCRQTLSISNHRVFVNDLNEHETVYGGRLLELWMVRRPFQLAA